MSRCYFCRNNFGGGTSCRECGFIPDYAAARGEEILQRAADLLEESRVALNALEDKDEFGFDSQPADALKAVVRALNELASLQGRIDFRKEEARHAAR